MASDRCYGASRPFLSLTCAVASEWEAVQQKLLETVRWEVDDSVVTIRIGTPCFQGASAGVHGYNSCRLVVLTNTFLPSELKSFLSAFDTKGLRCLRCYAS